MVDIRLVCQDHTDEAGQYVFGGVGYVIAMAVDVDGHRPRQRWQKAGENFQQGGLAQSIPADEGRQFAATKFC